MIISEKQFLAAFDKIEQLSKLGNEYTSEINHLVNEIIQYKGWEKISKEATQRGIEVHKLFESIIKGNKK